jgi:hypothetical protein
MMITENKASRMGVLRADQALAGYSTSSGEAEVASLLVLARERLS